MKIEVCRRCPHWFERMQVGYNDLAEIVMGCERTSMYFVTEMDLKRARRFMRKIGRKWCCNYGSRAYEKVPLEFPRIWRRTVNYALSEDELIENCEMRVEHMMEEWNE